MVCGISAIVFFSGMPSDAGGPVANTVPPTLMSASAEPAASISTAAIRAWNGERDFVVMWVVSSIDDVGQGRDRGILELRGARLAHRREAAEEQVGHQRRHLLVLEAAVG